MDGITIGHPCCAVHNCRRPLLSKRQHFCPEHQSQARLCRVTDPLCGKPAEDGFRSCSDPEHRALDLAHTEKSRLSLFQLKQRLENARVSHPTNAVSIDPVDDDDMDSASDDDQTNARARNMCEGKSADGNRKLRARWTRRQTHNELLIVRPCGVIIARYTMYGAEGIQEVKVRIRDDHLVTLGC